MVVQILTSIILLRELVVYSRWFGQIILAEPEFRWWLLLWLSIFTLRKITLPSKWWWILIGSHLLFLGVESIIAFPQFHRPIITIFDTTIILGVLYLNTQYAKSIGREPIQFLIQPIAIFASISAIVAIIGWSIAHIWIDHIDNWPVPASIFPKEQSEGQQYTFPFGTSLVMMFESQAKFLGFQFYRMGGWFPDQNTATVLYLPLLFMYPKWWMIPVGAFIFIAHSVTGILIGLSLLLLHGLLQRRYWLALLAGLTLCFVLVIPGTIREKVTDPYGSRVYSVIRGLGSDGQGIAFDNANPPNTGETSSDVIGRYQRNIWSLLFQFAHIGLVLRFSNPRRPIGLASLANLGFIMKEYGSLAFLSPVWFTLYVLTLDKERKE